MTNATPATMCACAPGACACAQVEPTTTTNKTTCRGVGQHGPRKNKIPPKKRKRRADTYKAGDLFESPLIPRKFIPQSGKYSTGVPIEDPVPLFGMLHTPSDLHRAFEMDDQLESWHTHAAPVDVRASPDAWSGTLSPPLRLIVRTATSMLERMCSIFCDDNDEAGAALWRRIRGADNDQREVNDESAPANQTILQTVAECCAMATKGSVEKRVLRASLCSLTRRKVVAFSKTIPKLHMPASSFSQGCQDLQALKQGLALERTTRTVRRLDTRSVDCVVAAVLSPENVSFNSWGYKRIKINGQYHSFPAIDRRRTRKAMLDSYIHSATLTNEAGNTVSQATFYRIATALTARDAKIQRAIDYVVGFLINDAFETLKEIIGLLDDDAQSTQRREMAFCSSYLKYGFDARIRDPAAPRCVLHSVAYGLNTNATQETSQLCSDCKSVFQFYRKLRSQLEQADASESTIQVVNDCCEKAKLYMAHKLRTVNQQQAIRAISSDMGKRCVQRGRSDEALVILDFKMKQEPVYYREKTVEHYGKRGMSWHGAMIQHFEVDSTNKEREPEAIAQRLYCDHISKNDSKQDREAVISMVEAVIMRLKQDLPHVKSIVLQADNATAYQNALLPLVFPYLSATHGIAITRFIHAETQDGKSMLDAHFARSNQVLFAWVREGNDCRTPTQLVVGLKSSGGASNTVVELVQHDRKALALLVAEVEQYEKQIRRVIKRANDVIITFPDSMVLSDLPGYRACPPFTATFFEYSGIGPGIAVSVNPADGICTVEKSATTDNNDQGDQRVTQDEDVGEDAILDELEASAEEAENSGDEAADEVDDEDPELEDREQDDDDTIDPLFSLGPVSGVSIATQGQLRKRMLRWRRPVTEIASPPDDLNARDAVSYAITRAMELQRTGVITITDPRTSTRPANDVVEMDPGNEPMVAPFLAGWATRPKRGEMYGRRYAAEFRVEIEELFMRGEANKSDKLGPGRMLELLRERHPYRFDLPAENEIRLEIAKLRMRKPSAPVRVADSTSIRRGRRASAHDSTIETFFVSLAQVEPSLKPREALQRFREKHSDLTWSDEQVKSKFSNTKTKLRKLKERGANNQGETRVDNEEARYENSRVITDDAAENTLTS